MMTVHLQRNKIGKVLKISEVTIPKLKIACISEIRQFCRVQSLLLVLLMMIENEIAVSGKGDPIVCTLRQTSKGTTDH